MAPTTSQKIESVKKVLDRLFQSKGGFLSLRLFNSTKELLDENFYWLSDSSGNYTGLEQMPKANLKLIATKVSDGKMEIKISNSHPNPVAFFNRVSLINAKTKKRILPVFYSDNYISVLPGEEKKIFIEYNQNDENSNCKVSIYGWNVDEQLVEIK